MLQNLTDIHEVVERAIFHAIKKICIQYGYTADTSAIGNGDVRPQIKALEDPIKQAHGFVVKVKGFGNNRSKGELEVPSIVCRGGNMVPGEIGGDGFPYLTRDQQTGNFNASIRPTTRHDYSFNIHLLANTQKQRRVLMALVSLALPRMGYIALKGEDKPILFIRFDGSVPTDDLDRGIMEEVYSYTATDLFLVEEYVLDNQISNIKEINVDIGIGSSDDPEVLDTLELE